MPFVDALPVLIQAFAELLQGELLHALVVFRRGPGGDDENALTTVPLLHGELRRGFGQHDRLGHETGALSGPGPQLDVQDWSDDKRVLVVAAWTTPENYQSVQQL